MRHVSDLYRQSTQAPGCCYVIVKLTTFQLSQVESSSQKRISPNPEGQQHDGILCMLRQRLHDVETVVRDLDDANYIEGFYHALNMNRECWQASGGESNDGDDLLHFLRTLD